MATRLEILKRWHLLRPYLDRRQQILWAATEAEVVGYRGCTLLHNLTGISVSAISARIRDIRPTKAATAGSLAHEPPYAAAENSLRFKTQTWNLPSRECCQMKSLATR